MMPRRHICLADLMEHLLCLARVLIDVGSGRSDVLEPFYVDVALKFEEGLRDLNFGCGLSSSSSSGLCLLAKPATSLVKLSMCYKPHNRLVVRTANVVCALKATSITRKVRSVLSDASKERCLKP